MKQALDEAKTLEKCFFHDPGGGSQNALFKIAVNVLDA